MNYYSVYLAGPITGCGYPEATNWRNEVTNLLRVDGRPNSTIRCFSPLRAKLYLSEEKSISDSYEGTVLSSQRGIFARDSFDCQRCDILFVNLLGAERVSIGTVMEIAWAWAYKKPIVLVIEEKGNIHEHAMIKEACPFTVHTIKDGVRLIENILLPDNH